MTACQTLAQSLSAIPPRNQLSHNTIFSAAPHHYEVTDLSSYTLYLFPLR